FPTARDFAGALEAAFREGGETQREAGADEPASRTVRRDDTVAVSASLKLGVEELRAIETQLTLHVGPMAKLLLKQSARLAADGPALVGMLAKYIPAEENRRTFIATAMERLSAGRGARAGGGPGRALSGTPD